MQTIPSKDVELEIEERTTLNYLLTFPTGCKKKDPKGIIFTIPGYGDTAVSEYQSKKLRPYLADKYDCIVAGVRYHNDQRFKDNYTINTDGICRFYGLEPSYFANCKNGNDAVSLISTILTSRGIYRLDPLVALSRECYDTYNSFGFLPALDHLRVLFDIINNYAIIKKKIIAFGSSYGGYIAMLMGKYAPQTFSLIIDNSGYCVADLPSIIGNLGSFSGASISFDNQGRRHEISEVINNKWNMDETSPLYFSDSHKKIRNLLEESHRVASDTIYSNFHSVQDTLVPVRQKDRFVDIISKYNRTVYMRVDKNDIDGKIFKTLDHGMSASLQGLYDYSINNIASLKKKNDDSSDFDLNSKYSFLCCDKVYNFAYDNKGLNVWIEKFKK